MKITFINHASFLLESAAASIWFDPWTRGKISNNFGALHSPSADVPYERVEHIWISHEHSDHFNFATLRAIPEEHRRRITILYQRHSSPRLVEAFRKLKFQNVKELPLYRWVHLKPGFDVLCGSVGTMDSFLAVRADSESLLNMNDCIGNDAQIRYIHRLVGDVSLLFTQFSFANWIGNRADETDSVQQKIRQLQYSVWTFRPEFTVPFASFAYFCNDENSWMNRFMITPACVAALDLPGVHFMYPGDEWDSSTRTFRSADAVSRYMHDLENVAIDPMPPPARDEEIRHAVLALLGALRRRFGKLILGRVEPFEIFTHDTNRIFSIFPGECRCEVREAAPATSASARYAMCSQVARYTFAHTWGWNVLEGGGPFIDRQFAEKGFNPLWTRCVTELSTDALRFDSPRRAFRTMRFLWEKKFEIFYKFFGRPITEEVLRKAAPDASRSTAPGVSSAVV